MLCYINLGGLINFYGKVEVSKWKRVKGCWIKNAHNKNYEYKMIFSLERFIENEYRSWLFFKKKLYYKRFSDFFKWRMNKQEIAFIFLLHHMIVFLAMITPYFYRRETENEKDKRNKYLNRIVLILCLLIIFTIPKS